MEEDILFYSEDPAFVYFCCIFLAIKYGPSLNKFSIIKH